MRDVLHPDTVFLAAVFVECNFFPVPSEPVNFPDDNYRELLFAAIGKHLLKFVPVVRPAAYSAVNVFVNDSVPPRVRVSSGGGKLPFNGLFPLLVGRIPGIDNGVLTGLSMLLFCRLFAVVFLKTVKFYVNLHTVSSQGIPRFLAV